MPSISLKLLTDFVNIGNQKHQKILLCGYMPILFYLIIYNNSLRLSSIVKEEYMENCLHSFLTSTNGNERIGLNISDRIRIMSSSIRQRLRINLNVLSPELSCSENGEKEIENFLYTGNVGPVHGQIVCVNPSFVTRVPNEPEWEANYSCSPFDAYFPITLDEQLTMEQQNPDSTAISNSPYLYCKTKLKSLIMELRSNKHRVAFYFYFETNSIDLCLRNQKLQNKFQVVHCSDLGDVVGLVSCLYFLFSNTSQLLYILNSTELLFLLRPISSLLRRVVCCRTTLQPSF